MIKETFLSRENKQLLLLFGLLMCLMLLLYEGAVYVYPKYTLWRKVSKMCMQIRNSREESERLRLIDRLGCLGPSGYEALCQFSVDSDSSIRIELYILGGTWIGDYGDYFEKKFLTHEGFAEKYVSFYILDFPRIVKTFTGRREFEDKVKDLRDALKGNDLHDMFQKKFVTVFFAKTLGRDLTGLSCTSLRQLSPEDMFKLVSQIMTKYGDRIDWNYELDRFELKKDEDTSDEEISSD